MTEAEFPRHCAAADVVGVTVDFDACHLINGKGHLGERRGGLGGEALIDVVLVNPVTDFARPCAHEGMETSAPEHLGLFTIEDPIREILAQIKRTAGAAEVLDLPVKVC